MPTLICDTELEARLRAERVLSGADRFDEVWEGIYVMAPLANNEHQRIVTRLSSVFEQVIGWPGLGQVFSGVNVSDQTESWETNYRCPDIAVFLAGTSAQNRDTHWFGGPDLAVEVVSKGDRIEEKLPFYANVKTTELLVIHRTPWRLESFRLTDGAMQSIRICQEGSSECEVISESLGLRFALVAGEQRPVVRVQHPESSQTWDV